MLRFIKIHLCHFLTFVFVGILCTSCASSSPKSNLKSGLGDNDNLTPADYIQTLVGRYRTQSNTNWGELIILPDRMIRAQQANGKNEIEIGQMVFLRPGLIEVSWGQRTIRYEIQISSGNLTLKEGPTEETWLLVREY